MGPKSLAAWQSHYCMWNSVPGLPSSWLLYPAGAADLSSLLLIVKWGIFIKLIKIQIHLSHWPASHFLLVLFMEETRILSETQAPPSASLSVPSVVATHLSFVSGTPTHPQGHWEGKPSLTSLKRPVPSVLDLSVLSLHRFVLTVAGWLLDLLTLISLWTWRRDHVYCLHCLISNTQYRAWHKGDT